MLLLLIPKSFSSGSDAILRRSADLLAITWYSYAPSHKTIVFSVLTVTLSNMVMVVSYLVVCAVVVVVMMVVVIVMSLLTRL